MLLLLVVVVLVVVVHVVHVVLDLSFHQMKIFFFSFLRKLSFCSVLKTQGRRELCFFQKMSQELLLSKKILHSCLVAR